jgi:outer membrane protein assembly factor BamB
MQHLSLSTDALTKIWQNSIGRGTTKTLPLTAQPIVVDNRIFALDTDSYLTALSASDGRRIWRVYIGDKDENDEVIGGGISYANGHLYVTTGYSHVLALNPVDGSTIWRKNINATSRAAPTIMGNHVFITTLNNSIISLDSATGDHQWDFSGISETTALIGAASPAANREIVVPAFSSGEIFALRVQNGSVAWSENLSSMNRYSGLAALSDIRGMPVIDKGLVVAVSFGGKVIAIDERTGRRIWQRDFGGSETPWIAGDHIFMLTSENELVALNRKDGSIRWVTKLKKYKDADSQKHPLAWTGPVLAGGRLIIAGTEGRIVEVYPENGQVVREWLAGETITISPVVANDILYLLADDGTLMAYR